MTEVDYLRSSIMSSDQKLVKTFEFQQNYFMPEQHSLEYLCCFDLWIHVQFREKNVKNNIHKDVPHTVNT